MKKFVVDEGFWKIFPEAVIAVLTVKNVQEGIHLAPEKAEEIKNLLDSANEGAKRFLTSEVISENAVVQAWREAVSDEERGEVLSGSTPEESSERNSGGNDCADSRYFQRDFFKARFSDWCRKYGCLSGRLAPWRYARRRRVLANRFRQDGTATGRRNSIL